MKKLFIILLFFSSKLIAQRDYSKMDTTIIYKKKYYDSLVAVYHDKDQNTLKFLDNYNNTIYFGNWYEPSCVKSAFSEIVKINNSVNHLQLINFYDKLTLKLIETYFIDSCRNKIGFGYIYNDSLEKFDLINHDLNYKIDVVKPKKIIKKYLKSIKDTRKHDYSNDHLCLKKIKIDGVSAYQIDYQLTDTMTLICTMNAKNGKILSIRYYNSNY
jgi:hypothetical protein